MRLLLPAASPWRRPQTLLLTTNSPLRSSSQLPRLCEWSGVASTLRERQTPWSGSLHRRRPLHESTAGRAIMLSAALPSSPFFQLCSKSAKYWPPEERQRAGVPNGASGRLSCGSERCEKRLSLPLRRLLRGLMSTHHPRTSPITGQNRGTIALRHRQGRVWPSTSILPRGRSRNRPFPRKQANSASAALHHEKPT